MANDPTQRSGQDRDHIDVQQEQAVNDWAKKFDVSAEQIREAVQAVGHRAADVEMHLKGSHATTNADSAQAANAAQGQG